MQASHQASFARSGAKVLVTGCYSQVAQAELKDLPGVVAVTGVLDRAAGGDCP